MAPTAPAPAAAVLDPDQGARAVALGGSLCAATLLTYMVVTLPDRLMLSDYVHVAGGLEPFVGGLLALAVAALAVSRLAAPGCRGAAVALRVSAGATVVAAAFPTDATRVPSPSLSGQIHRYAALLVFVGVPLAGWLLARGVPGAAARAVRWVVFVSAVAVAATLLMHPHSPVAEALGRPGWEGVFQRALATSDLVLLAAMAVTAGRLSGAGSKPRSTGSAKRFVTAGHVLARPRASCTVPAVTTATQMTYAARWPGESGSRSCNRAAPSTTATTGAVASLAGKLAASAPTWKETWVRTSAAAPSTSRQNSGTHPSGWVSRAAPNRCHDVATASSMTATSPNQAPATAP